MVYLSKMTRAQSKAIDQMHQAAHDRANLQKPKQNPVYRDMQNIVDKAGRGERL